jgi:hypothetical protein
MPSAYLVNAAMRASGAIVLAENRVFIERILSRVKGYSSFTTGIFRCGLNLITESHIPPIYFGKLSVVWIQGGQMQKAIVKSVRGNYLHIELFKPWRGIAGDSPREDGVYLWWENSWWKIPKTTRPTYSPT